MARQPKLLTKANGVTTVRVLMLLVSTMYASTYPLVFAFLYTVSQVLDMLDGYVSRYYNESTLVGAAYDQLLDRMSSSYLCFINGKQHPQYLEWFYLLMVIDICGHWLHNYACALYSNTNHKDVKDAYFILRVYYQTKWLMVAAILMYESFLGAMYVRPMYPSGHIIHGFMTIVLYVSAPLFAYKTLTNFLQGVYGCSRIMRYDIETAN